VCNDNFAVLTPFNTEADPMEIRVDIIQRESSRVVVHNAWLEKALHVNAKEVSLSQNDGESRSKAGILMSPFRRLGSGRKKKKDKRSSDSAVDRNESQTSSPQAAAEPLFEFSDKTPRNKSHKRTATGSSSIPTPKPPQFRGSSDRFGDSQQDDVSSDEDFIEDQDKEKTKNEWQNPTLVLPDFSKPLGIGDEDELSPTTNVKPNNLPPPTLTNIHKDRWGNSFSSAVDESSLGSSVGGQTSNSSTDGASGGRSKTKRTGGLLSRFGYRAESSKGTATTEEDDKMSPVAPIDTEQSRNTASSSGSGHKFTLELSSGALGASSGAAEDLGTPRKVVDLGELSSADENDDHDDKYSIGQSRIISPHSTANDINDRPMCIRVEVLQLI
jgi:hypothetical protein